MRILLYLPSSTQTIDKMQRKKLKKIEILTRTFFHYMFWPIKQKSTFTKGITYKIIRLHKLNCKK